MNLMLMNVATRKVGRAVRPPEAAKGFRRFKTRKQLPVRKSALLKHRESDADGVDETPEAT